jgi:hypothetical protein
VTPSQSNEHDRDTPMTGIYIAVVVLEAAIIALLFLFGRIYS